MKKVTFCLLATLGIVSFSCADTLRTIDGAVLTGTITLIDKGVIHLNTTYAGSLQIKQDQVASFESDAPRTVRLKSGAVMIGPITSDGANTIRIRSEDGVLETSTAKIAAAWQPSSEDPEIVRERRVWRYSASFDLTGKKGNTDKYQVGTSLVADLKGRDDTLRFFLEYEQAETNGARTEDRTAGGASYEAFFREVHGWYLRTELESDPIDKVDLRSTTGGGFSYRMINREQKTLVARTGLGYRFTAFDDDSENESSATLDLGLAYTYRFNETFKMKNELKFVPAIDDFSNYRFIHDSGIEVPVGSGEKWKIRIGLKNDYHSQTTAEEKLDTSYYTKMIYSWE